MEQTYIATRVNIIVPFKWNEGQELTNFEKKSATDADNNIFINKQYFCKHINALFTSGKIKTYQLIEGCTEIKKFFAQDTAAYVSEKLKKNKVNADYLLTEDDFKDIYLYLFSTNIGYLIFSKEEICGTAFSDAKESIFHLTDCKRKYWSQNNRVIVVGLAEKILDSAGMLLSPDKFYMYTDAYIKTNTENSLNIEKQIEESILKKPVEEFDANVYDHDSLQKQLNYSLVGDVYTVGQGICDNAEQLDGGKIKYSYRYNDRIVLYKERDCVVVDLLKSKQSDNRKFSIPDNNRGVSNGFLFTYLYALHEYQALSDFIAQSVQEDERSEKQVEVLYQSLLSLQKYYIYNIISDETRYQIFYAGLIDYFRNASLEQEVTNISDRLIEEQRQKAAEEQKNRNKTLNFMLIIISFLSVISVFTDVSDLWPGSGMAMRVLSILFIVAIVIVLIKRAVEYFRNKKSKIK